jgi:hypothetical protein
VGGQGQPGLLPSATEPTRGAQLTGEQATQMPVHPGGDA